MGSKAWIINAPTVVSEIIDGELVVINFDSGNYYSSLGVGAWLWQCIEQRVPRDVIIAALASRFGIAADQARADVDSYIRDLLREKLIRPDGAEVPSCEEAPAFSAGDYGRPQIVAYSNMQDLLLLDPIHDVGDEGWPTRPADS